MMGEKIKTKYMNSIEICNVAFELHRLIWIAVQSLSKWH